VSGPDPAERYLSPPPPPQGLRARWREDRRSLVRTAAIVIAALAAAIAVVSFAGGDGEGSGNLARAFGGYISPEDNDTLAAGSIANYNAERSYVVLAEAVRDRDLRALARAAAAGRRYEERALAYARQIRNEKLRRTLVRVIPPRREVFVAWASVARYALTHHRGLKATPRALFQRAAEAEADSRAVTGEYARRLAFYMTPAQRRELENEQQIWTDGLRAAGE
jgi:hypothetical protein